MRTIGSYEAKTHLPRLLDEVAAGESIIITKHGVPVARLVPPENQSRQDVASAIAAIRELRERVRPLGEITIRDLIEEGRRF